MNKESKHHMDVDLSQMTDLIPVLHSDMRYMKWGKMDTNIRWLKYRMDLDGSGGSPTANVTVNGKSADENGNIELGAQDVGAAKMEHIHTKATDTSDGFMSKTEHVKLGGIEEGATKNSSDAYLLNRSNHTGTQAPDTITGLVYALAKVPERVGVSGIINTPGDSLTLSINDVEIYAYYSQDDINTIVQKVRCKQDKDVIIDLTYISTDGNGTNYPYGIDMMHLTREGQIFNISRDIYSFSFNTGYLRENGRVWKIGAFFSQMGRECSLFAERII